MWFKNLSLMRVEKDALPDDEQWEERLNEGRFKPCGALEPLSLGWVAPTGGEDAPLFHRCNGYLMLCLQKEEKLLPGSLVNEELSERVAALEEERGTPVRKKERQEIRDAIIHEFLPRAFSFRRRQYAYLDLQGGWMIVDTPSARKAEDVASWLRKSLGSLPTAWIKVKERPSSVLTQWVSNPDITPADIVIADECELRATDDEGGVVRCRRQDLSVPEIRNHIDAGKEVSKLAMSWADRLSFVLDDDLSVRRLKFLDLVQDQAADIEAADEVQRFDADFSIMSLELSGFIPRLLELFGGEDARKVAG